MSEGEEDRSHAEIRDSVRKLCLEFPGDYWRALDRESAYPTEFVKALTEAGYLAALIPEEYGGSGLPLSAAVAILEEIQRAGCNGAACHAQMYIMGALLRHGSDAQKAQYLPGIASGELRTSGIRRHRTVQRVGHRVAQDLCRARRRQSYVVNGQKVWTSRAQYSDLMLVLARTTPKERGRQTNRRIVGFHRRHARRLG